MVDRTSRRIVIEELCEHTDTLTFDGKKIDGKRPHPMGPSSGYNRGGGKTYERWCQGATVLSEPTEEMVERAAITIHELRCEQKGPTDGDVARAALDRCPVLVGCR